ncbi:MAG: cupin domain-containing protein [Candidatus Eiseniibacteriota bacterium]|jgi:anti-sigma factor ChrR (cupin superfamily)
MEPIAVNASDRPWEPVDGVPGMKRKVLRRGQDQRPRVALLKLAAGFEHDAHAHERAENHYVLEGMYESQGREYPAGSYRYVPRQAEHGPFRSAAGATLLVVWED